MKLNALITFSPRIPIFSIPKFQPSTLEMGNDTMKAVVFKGPHKVVIEDRPIPKIRDATDIIVKVDKVTIHNHPTE